MDFRDIQEFIKDSLGYIIFFMTTFIIVFYVISLSIVVGPSMTPKYQDNDVIILDKLKYRLLPIKRFDIVSFRYKEKYYTKRIIALPGEKVMYKNNKLYINGKYIKEPFEKETTQDMQSPVYITSGNYYVLGDNRINSEDSRDLGLIPKETIIGKVELRLWPVLR